MLSDNGRLLSNGWGNEKLSGYVSRWWYIYLTWMRVGEMVNDTIMTFYEGPGCILELLLYQWSGLNEMSRDLDCRLSTNPGLDIDLLRIASKLLKTPNQEQTGLWCLGWWKPNPRRDLRKGSMSRSAVLWSDSSIDLSGQPCTPKQDDWCAVTCP